jgi:hypothetical protein
MNAHKRRENERKFGQWEPLPNGGRRYFYNVPSRRTGWMARYVKDVNNREETIRFVQEIYNAEGILVASHQKFPEDTGHQRIKDIS